MNITSAEASNSYVWLGNALLKEFANASDRGDVATGLLTDDSDGENTAGSGRQPIDRQSLVTRHTPNIRGRNASACADSFQTLGNGDVRMGRRQSRQLSARLSPRPPPGYAPTLIASFSGGCTCGRRRPSTWRRCPRSTRRWIYGEVGWTVGSPSAVPRCEW